MKRLLAVTVLAISGVALIAAMVVAFGWLGLVVLAGSIAFALLIAWALWEVL